MMLELELVVMGSLVIKVRRVAGFGVGGGMSGGCTSYATCQRNIDRPHRGPS